MSLRKFKFPYRGSSNQELSGGIISLSKLDKKIYDSDSKELSPFGVVVFPGWGVRMEALEPLAQRLVLETNKDVLVVEENYDFPRDRTLSNREYHMEVVRSALDLLEDKSLVVAYSKACVSVTQAFEGYADKKHLVYLQGPFLDKPITSNQLSARFVSEGLTDSLSIGNWSGLMSYSIGLARDVFLRPRNLMNALEDIGLIAEGVDRELIPDKSLALQSSDDSLFPYDEAKLVWESIGRLNDLVPLQKGSVRRGHLYPIIEGEFTGHYLINHLRRRFGNEAI